MENVGVVRSSRWSLVIGLLAAASARAQVVPQWTVTAYRLVPQTVYEERPVTAYRLRYETVVEEQPVTT